MIHSKSSLNIPSIDETELKKRMTPAHPSQLLDALQDKIHEDLSSPKRVPIKKITVKK